MQRSSRAGFSLAAIERTPRVYRNELISAAWSFFFLFFLLNRECDAQLLLIALPLNIYIRSGILNNAHFIKLQSCTKGIASSKKVSFRV